MNFFHIFQLDMTPMRAENHECAVPYKLVRGHFRLDCTPELRHARTLLIGDTSAGYCFVGVKQ
jgi:hypothetical protein